MKAGNILQAKSYAFAIRVVNLYKNLIAKKKELVISKQILRCGTSIGANVEEAIGAQSRADFISKLSIAYKEAREASYWLRLLKDTGYIPLPSSKVFTMIRKSSVVLSVQFKSPRKLVIRNS
jgi:four helix bundle protein